MCCGTHLKSISPNLRLLHFFLPLLGEAIIFFIIIKIYFTCDPVVRAKARKQLTSSIFTARLRVWAEEEKGFWSQDSCVAVTKTVDAISITRELDVVMLYQRSACFPLAIHLCACVCTLLLPLTHNQQWTVRKWGSSTRSRSPEWVILTVDNQKRNEPSVCT